MGSEKYKLKWSKYESNILSAFHGLLESETLSDVTLFCEGKQTLFTNFFRSWFVSDTQYKQNYLYQYLRLSHQIILQLK